MNSDIVASQLKEKEVLAASQLKETIAELVKKEVSEKYQKMKEEIIEEKPKPEIKPAVVEV